ncbi:nuclear-pore anchor [Arachis hypogaea]|uniref:Uncharacterized protein n=1 Tax=Arachis hypogaea TaxID=3818 RepID=A0A444YQ97_ARAHY|nr:nuclear-pore anchor [Arachis hypogaea]QHN86542.1 Nuclear-pore anchor [Arachis hypogaea]RYR04077.1 hypothetical protein Ahy_B06g083630 [Arachis hypogaea]
MPLFLSDEEFARCSGDSATVAAKADAYIRSLLQELDTLRARSHAADINAEQNCSLVEQKFLTLASDFSSLQYRVSELESDIERRNRDLVDVRSQNHQVQLQLVEKDREIERLRTEVSEVHKSKRQLIELNDQKDLELSEKNATIKSYLDKIVHMSENAAQKEARISELEAELGRSKAACTRFEQEKEILERQNAWLNDELTDKVNSYFELRKKHTELDADMSSKLADVERQFSECSKSLQWNKDRVRELETQLKSLQEDLISAKDAAAANEERLSAELSTVNKLNDLYKESSEEWSRKAADLEGVIQAIESQLKQVEDDYKERLEKEVTSRNQAEKEAADLKGKLERLEAEIEARKKTTEPSDHSLSIFAAEPWTASIEDDNMADENNLLVTKIPVGVSGTALAASLLRDGWSLAKMYAKYQEAVDALRHEQLGRKESEAILHRILYELEEKAEAIIHERAEHEKMVEAYSSMNQKLQNSLTENANLEKSIQELKADLRRHERDYNLAQKEIDDLQKQVTLLLKECRDIQLRCGSIGYDIVEDVANIASRTNMETEAEKIISEHLLTFKDINGLVEQNVQLRSLVRSLSGQIENQEVEFKERLELELKKHSDEAAAKVAAVLQRAEEQGRMIESLHTSVAMYKRLYEEEHSIHLSQTHSSEAHTVVKDVGRNDLAALIDSSQEVAKRSLEKAAERVRCLEEDLAKARSDIIVLRSERDKMELQAKFSKERLDSFMKEFEHQKAEANSILARNVEFSQLIVDYQRKLRESSGSLNAAEELSRRVTMEFSVLKRENEVLSNAEKRASDEVRSLSERVQRLQASLGTIQSAEEVREEARAAERVKQEEYIKKLEREWAEAKRDLQEERENMRRLMQDRDQTIKNTMRQVEDLSKELANALRAVASAESRAAVAEAKLSGLQRKMGSVDDKVSEKVGVSGLPSSSSDEVDGELQTAKAEIEKLKEEVDANKAHMLQYKSIAEVNEDALKRIETAHENYKVEAENEKKALEAEVHSLREKVAELENETSLKCEEVASASAGKDKALASALAQITTLKEEILAKCSQISAMEVQMSGFKEQLDEEHKKWRTAQDNYERQVILQSETIQELKRTSEALAMLQGEASELRKLADAQKFENSQLKAKWEEEKTLLEKARNDAEKKYDEINEQNKILHSHLEALHIRRAEKERNAAGISSGSSSADTIGDAGLQAVMTYLRNSKEISETEVSALKQEKLRLQLQLEGALKAVESAHASVEAERAKSKSCLSTEEEFKSLQLQVREMNLLRESNMQLREENKHNFEECQKLRELAHKARAEVENLENLLKEREMELALCKNEIEGLKREKDDLCHKVSELLERSKNINMEDYDRSKKLVRDLQERLKEKDSKLDEMGKTLSVKQDSVARLEQDLSNCRVELAEREKRINDISQSEVSLKHEVDRQKKMLGSWKIKNESLSKEVQQLSKQVDEIKQGKRLTTDTTGDHAMKEEKDTRIQILEKTVERQRDELKKEKEENRMEKGRRIKTEKAIKDSYNNVEQEKAKFINELERHKEALKRLSEEVEKVKDVGSLPEGANAVQLLSGTNVDDLAAPYVSAVESFQKEAHSVFSELGDHGNLGDATTVMDTSAAATASVVHAPTSSVVSLPAVGVSGLPPKATTDTDKRPTFSRPTAEPRKTGRKLVRPRLVKPDEPQGDTEMSDAEGSGKPGPSEGEPQTGFAPSQPLARKRVAPTSTSELREESVAVGEKSSETLMLKKSKGSESPGDSGEDQPATTPELTGTNLASEELERGELPQGQNAGVVEAENEDGEIPVGKDEEAIDPQNLDGTNQEELHDDKPIDLEENQDQAAELKMGSDDMQRDQIEAENQPSSFAVAGEREEGELLPETGELEGGNEENQDSREGQPEPVRTPEPSPTRADDEALEAGEISSPVLSGDDKNDEGELTEEAGDTLDKASDVNESTVETSTAVETDQVAEPTPSASEVAPATIAVETSSSRLVTRQAPAETDDVKQTSPLNSSSTTINLLERARERAQLRQAGVVSTGGRARGRVLRGRGVRGRGRRPPTSES